MVRTSLCECDDATDKVKGDSPPGVTLFAAFNIQRKELNKQKQSPQKGQRTFSCVLLVDLRTVWSLTVTYFWADRNVLRTESSRRKAHD